VELSDSRRRLASEMYYRDDPLGFAGKRPDFEGRRKRNSKAEKKRFLRPIIGEKEVRFFDLAWYTEAVNLAGSDEKAFGWYLDVFPIIPAPGEPASAWDLSRGKITGEASPTYIKKGSSPTLIREHLPEVKIILMLRNPVDRVYSERNMLLEIREAVGRFNKQHGREARAKPPKEGEQTSFAQLVYYSRAGPGDKMKDIPEHLNNRDFAAQIHRMERALNQSIYHLQLEPWTRIFTQEQLMFIRSEDFFENEIRIMHRVEDFLGIKRLPDKLWKPIVDEVYNLHIDPKTKEFKPVAQHMEIGQRLHSDNDDRMSKETRDILSKFYAPYNERLKKLLSPWKFQTWS